MSPLKLLWRLQGTSVRVRLKSGLDYTGTLISSDKYFNLYLKQARQNNQIWSELWIRNNQILYLQSIV
ncbi:hypothetical protein NEHOM01_0562 [Nematocida homosporus]|uniref:uncharacterized protein n=1 Tax=Nematocida homosporus TaxID=1912981 RepID=UPI00222020A9|nr:uncharacterized protein NEHOM01_0562 [Nematocida homosporus]KAI5185057.1 hypothetical protein NEHOM01_0562 [Nematocida homosporus]